MDVLAMLSQEPLDPTSDVPLYQQLRSRLLQVIASHSLDENTPLPTEVAIAEALHLSRGTVRRCFEELVREGRVVRRRGHGTYVNHGQQAKRGDATFNYTAEIQSLGKTPSSKVFGFRQMIARHTLVQKLNVPAGEPVWEVRRIRYANDDPMQYATAYVPVHYCPDLTRQDAEQSLYAAIARQSGAMPAKAVEFYEAISLDAKEAAALQVPCGAAAIRIMRTTYEQHGNIMETSIITCRGDLNRFLVTMDGGKATFQKVLS